MAPVPRSRLLLLAALLGLVAAAVCLGPDRKQVFGWLAANREWLLAEIERLGVAAPLLYTGLYAAAAALSLPGGIVLSFAAGFFFGPLWGAVCAVGGATLGASIVFLLAKTALGNALREKAGASVQRLREGFQQDAFNYLLFLRLVPLFPFWLVNLVPAFLGVRFRTFVIATFIGIIPATAVFAGIGNGLGAVIDRGEEPNFAVVLEPQVLLPLLGLALLSVAPVAYRRFKRPAAAGSA